ncbi:hypothetical protein BDV37DRAFT_255497 [Aspergillus pseudonomiae]|uniref:Uncharacterized protein n=1 Tax=Aspergillus pseudonomiae TaxID=1506151 RepID=A0A5N7D4D9_9EURO|nr:uncharacterized protein BDV37DRAFT_255497 [Aspergillus pseudonomiae]KAE8401264.1 hypothetical protein BDV37DRAFT_255497 [Aspergillus pseudonomiae]
MACHRNTMLGICFTSYDWTLSCKFQCWNITRRRPLHCLTPFLRHRFVICYLLYFFNFFHTLTSSLFLVPLLFKRK